ncbi:hypothetical protein Tco_0839073 [Tanacetum coccineum]|uniref:Uncharacterized protein n=1 Tax=Tanacetum coccineum TaxID=301880 RepID=A0ABQ5APL8_9ASTR
MIYRSSSPITSQSKGDSTDPTSSNENLVPIPSIRGYIADPSPRECAGELAHIAPNSTGIVEAFDPNDDTFRYYDTFENIVYVDASPSYESNVILREKLLNVHRVISNIESLKNNPTPDRVFKSPSLFPIPIVESDSFFEEPDTSLSYLDNSLPEFETSSNHTEETRSGSTTTHANYTLPEYDSFLFEIEPNEEGLISIDNSNNTLLELSEFESFHFDPSFPRPPPEPPDVEKCFEPEAGLNQQFLKTPVFDVVFRFTRASYPLFEISTDKTNITRKPSKTGKHEHEKRKSTREAKDSKPKPEKVKSQSKKVKP